MCKVLEKKKKKELCYENFTIGCNNDKVMFTPKKKGDVKIL